MTDREAFEKWCADHPNDTITPDWIAWQAAAAAERERAAKVCEAMVRNDKHGYPDYPSSYAQECADAIRKGTTP